MGKLAADYADYADYADKISCALDELVELDSIGPSTPGAGANA